MDGKHEGKVTFHKSQVTKHKTQNTISTSRTQHRHSSFLIIHSSFFRFKPFQPPPWTVGVIDGDRTDAAAVRFGVFFVHGVGDVEGERTFVIVRAADGDGPPPLLSVGKGERVGLAGGEREVPRTHLGRDAVVAGEAVQAAAGGAVVDGVHRGERRAGSVAVRTFFPDDHGVRRSVEERPPGAFHQREPRGVVAGQVMEVAVVPPVPGLERIERRRIVGVG